MRTCATYFRISSKLKFTVRLFYFQQTIQTFEFQPNAWLRYFGKISLNFFRIVKFIVVT